MWATQDSPIASLTVNPNNESQRQQPTVKAASPDIEPF